jgi:organic hydroperoxide reductase OsmC/OhrA
MTQVVLFPSLTILREEDRAKADRILHKAKEACLISRSVKSEVLMQPTIDVALEAAV